jgi:hypothetical protein
MLKSNKSRMAFILSVFSALCLFGAGCKQQADEVPALNKEPASADAFAQADAEKASADAKAAEEAKLAADAKAKTEADAKLAEKAAADAKADAEAKIAADMKAAEEAKLAADAKAKADADATKVASDATSDDAKAVADAKAKAELDATSKGVVADNAAPVAPPAAPCPVGIASDLASHLASAEIAKHFGAGHGRLVVQVNRATNRSNLTVNRSEMLRVMQDAVVKTKDVVSTASLRGPGQVKRPKAIHLAFDVESKAIGLVPSYKIGDAPAVIVNTLVEDSDKGAKLTVSAVDARTGKVFWTDSKSLVAEEAKAECCGECGGEDHHDAAKHADAAHPDAATACPTCKPEAAPAAKSE